MALPDLATVADLAARNIDSNPTGVDILALLGSASDEVRSAAGVPISRATWTATIPGVPDQWLSLPGQPVVSVSDVEIDGSEVTGWKLVGGDLWRESGWQPLCEPSNVTATITGGLVTVPRDIVDLVCSMVGFAANQAVDGYATRGDLISARVDDYSEQYQSGGERTAGPMELPEATRCRLRSRFGGGAGVVKIR